MLILRCLRVVVVKIEDAPLHARVLDADIFAGELIQRLEQRSALRGRYGPWRSIGVQIVIRFRDQFRQLRFRVVLQRRFRFGL